MSQKFPGGFITKSPVAPTTSAASGIWTLDQQEQYQKAGTWPQQPPPPYVEDVFSTYLYTGNGSTQIITNGIDLSTKGGLTWLKRRDAVSSQVLYDTARGATKVLSSNNTDAEVTATGGLTAFNVDGFTLGANYPNTNAATFASWTFRKQAKFFDIVTYTGNGGTPQNISHSLGSVPGFIVVKPTSTTGGWICYHRSLTASGFNPAPYNTINLNSSGSIMEDTGAWNSTAPTSTVFTIGSSPDVNTNGASYVAYLFAHDAGGFGATETDNVISCGSWSTTLVSGRYDAIIDLGWEPQWVMFKPTNNSGSWQIYDNMRGWTSNSAGSNVSQRLYPNLSNAEDTDTNTQIQYDGIGKIRLAVGASGYSGIYVAIRRGPMKTPTSGTSVFSPVAYSGTGATRTITAGFPVDLAIPKMRSAATNGAEWYSRLIGPGIALLSAYSAGDLSRPDELTSFASNTGVVLGPSTTSGGTNASGYTYVDWNFARAPNFVDIVCFKGAGGLFTRTHNLGVAPELVIIKDRSASSTWDVLYAAGSGLIGFLNYNLEFNYGGNSPAANFSANGSTYQAPTSTTLYLNNYTTDNYVAYLFASCPNVSKVGTYTGTGATQIIACGFTGGARFVLIKRTDSTGDWYVWDTARALS